MMKAEAVASLKRSYVEQNLATRKVSPCFMGPRGNLLSIACRGDISHPANVFSVEIKWAFLVDKCVEKATYGMRQSLRPSFQALSRISTETQYARVAVLHV